MPNSSFTHVCVRGVVTCVPKTERKIDDELDLFGGNVKQLERLKQTIGLDRRRVVEPGVTTADLCETAARQLLLDTSVSIDMIDGIVFVTQTPDHSQPCNAAILHGRLSASKSCASFDVNLGCSGYVYGLWLAHLMIAAGGCQRILLLAGDTISALVHPKDRGVAPLFGDGGSATLVEAGKTAMPSWFSLNTDGSGSQHLIVPAGGFRQPRSEATKVDQTDADGNTRSAENLYMNGAEVFNFSISEEPKAVKAILEYSGLSADAIDYYVFHQANRYMLKSIAKRLKLDVDRVPMATVERYGNQSSASIPCALCGELSESMCASESKQVLLSGFGVGLSWASAILPLGQMDSCRLIEFEG